MSDNLENTLAPFPLDWDDWRAAWAQWRAVHADDLKPTRERFPGRNFLASEVLGTWKVRGRLVELSEVTFPDFGSRPQGNDMRAIGLTFGIGLESSGTVVHSFDELERELGL